MARERTLTVEDQRVEAPGEEVLRIESVTKRFPGVTALKNVSFDLRTGEVHVLFGENGAGKSTLINVIAGTYPPDGGRIFLRGEQIVHLSPHEARVKGINAVFQDFSLVPTLSVEENLFLGREPGRVGIIDRSARREQAVAALKRVRAPFSVTARVDLLPRSSQQLVEIAKALLGDPSILILDEPTTSLTEEEVELLFELVEQLRSEGIAVIYITHRMREVFRIGDRITVLRDGEKVATVRAAEAGEGRLIELMTGRTLETLYPAADRQPGEVRLRLDRVSGRRVRDVSLEVRAGEVVGIAGLVGSGKSEIGRLCYGLEPLLGGTIRLDGRAIRHDGLGPKQMLKRGLIYHPADRRGEGLVLPRPLRENVSLAALDRPGFSKRGFLRRAQERRRVAKIVARLRIQPPHAERRVALFSGGNQQKIVLARALTRDVDVHIFDEPTAGVDIGARVEVYEFMKELCERGSAVMLISSDLPEVVNLSHRVYVIHGGRVRALLEGHRITEERVLASFFETEEED